MILYENYTPERFPRYDNYDAIEVDKVKSIPKDYFGVMGVPITFLDNYSPQQFKILGIASGREEFDVRSHPTKRYQNAVQHSIKTRKTALGSKVNTGAELLFKNIEEFVKYTAGKKDTYYTADGIDGVLYRLYDRVLIKRKENK